MENKGYQWAVLLLGIAMSGGVVAKTIGDPAAGQDKAALCGGCHGTDGNSEDATFPRLASQYEDYIVKQIQDFQSGVRANNDIMAGMAATVASLQDARDIASYFAKQKMSSKSLTPKDAKLAQKGEQLYKDGKDNVYGCINCHGENGKGRGAKVNAFPVIGGQHRDYLIKQLKDFKAAGRSNDPAGMMSNIAKQLSDEEIKALAEYLSSF